MNALRITLFTTTMAGVLALAGCSSVGPDYQAPAATVPESWRDGADGRFATGSDAGSAHWWHAFEDPVLETLITRAVEQGPDRREAMARLREARALRGVSAADRFPTLDATAGYRRYRESEFTPFGSQAPGDTDLYTAGLDASWELDLWGRVRRSVEAADADLAATAEDTRGVFLAVAAETALSYVELRAFQRRVAIARTNVELQEQTLALVQARYDAGFVGARDLAQASTNVAVTRSRVPAMEAGERAAENRLTVLLGVAPGTLAGELDASRTIPVPPVTAAVGVPAEVVRNRPDIRRAERALAAEHARVGVAVGDLYPRLALAGSIGVAAGDTSDLFQSGSELFGIGPSVRWNLFDGARLRRRVEAQNARVEQAFVRWERAVLVGLEESETAMTTYLREQTRRRELLEGATQARRAVELAQFEYREGQSDFQTVLDSERALAELEDELARTEAGIATQFVVLHKALGSS